MLVVLSTMTWYCTAHSAYVMHYTDVYVSPCRSFVTTELVSLVPTLGLKWIDEDTIKYEYLLTLCWVSTVVCHKNNGLMWGTHTHMTLSYVVGARHETNIFFVCVWVAHQTVRLPVRIQHETMADSRILPSRYQYILPCGHWTTTHHTSPPYRVRQTRHTHSV